MPEKLPNQALHRIAARLRMLLNLKRLVWAARGERWALGFTCAMNRHSLFGLLVGNVIT